MTKVNVTLYCGPDEIPITCELPYYEDADVLAQMAVEYFQTQGITVTDVCDLIEVEPV